MKSSKLLLAFSILAGLQVLAGGAALADVIGATAFALFVLVVSAVQTGLSFYANNGQVVSSNNVASYVNQEGNSVAGPASPIDNGTPVEVHAVGD